MKDSEKHTADTRNPKWDNYAPQGHGRSDEQIRADVHDALQKLHASQPAAAEQLSISVDAGVVTLSGRAASQAEQRRIVELVRAIPSVRELRDQLRAPEERQ